MLDYPGLTTFLTHESPFQLLIAVILSAQCTDERVNLTTPALFAAYPTAEAMKGAEVDHLMMLLRSINYYKTKAKNIKLTATMVADQFNGKVPDTMESLISFPGVGRKTANVVLGQAFGKPGITVDTHLKRLTRRMGFTKALDAVKVEFELQSIWNPDIWSDFSSVLIVHGRQVCHSRKPQCESCSVAHYCKKKFL